MNIKKINYTQSISLISLLYIYVPVYLFLLGWLKPVFSIPICVILFYPLIHFYRSMSLYNKSFLKINNILDAVFQLLSIGGGGITNMLFCRFKW